MSKYTTEPPRATISYEQHLLDRIADAERGVVRICGPDIIDDRAWWQHLAGLNPYAELEAAARTAEHQAQVRAGAQAEAEAG